MNLKQKERASSSILYDIVAFAVLTTSMVDGHTMVKQGSQRSCKVRDRVPTSDQVKDGVTEFTRGQPGRARSCEVMDGVLEVRHGR